MLKLTNEELNRKTGEQFKNSKKLPVVLVLDNVRSMNNVGSIFRTADAFLLEAIYLCGITPCPPHRDIQKTALGATETVSWKHFDNTEECVKFLQQQNFTIVAIEQVDGGISLDDFMPDSEKKYAFIFGNEVNGVDQHIIDLCNLCIEIPQFGTKHSFNVAVSAGIVLWHYFVK
jgi:23S rRNA (guanosine2251-2'-O)-methyltransferase